MPKVPKYLLSVIPHSEHRYPTVGDWRPGTPDEVIVSDMHNEDYEFLVMIHELLEFYLCKKRGIRDQDVTAFDVQFEKERDKGLHTIADEPGDSPLAPYFREHQFATAIERVLARELGVDWDTYSDIVESL